MLDFVLISLSFCSPMKVSSILSRQKKLVSSCSTPCLTTGRAADPARGAPRRGRAAFAASRHHLRKPPASPEPSPSTSAGSTPLCLASESNNHLDASYASGATDDTSNLALDTMEELIYVDDDVLTVAARPPHAPRSAASSAYPVIFWIGHRPRHGAHSLFPLRRL